MDSFDVRLDRAREALSRAERIVVGGGAGLSAAAGLTYSGPRFEEHFSDFMQKYGIRDMYSASFYPFPTREEHWAQWVRHIHVNRYLPGPTPLYGAFLSLVGAKPFFVITTNVESQFEKAGFPAGRIFEIQGNYAYFQCAKGCHDTRYRNEAQVGAMLAATDDCMIPTALIPACPVCGGPMDVNLRHDEHFVQDASWHESASRYGAFLQELPGRPFACLELGVGYNTPGIIRYPFEQIVHRNRDATLIRINRDDPLGVPENEDRTITFSEDMNLVVRELLRGMPSAAGGDDA